jgi:SAM-dependent methyltransferase
MMTAMPLIGCQFADSRAAALQAPRGTIELVQCQACGHIYNRAFEPDRMRYAPGYDNALGFSPRHRSEMEATVDRLIGTYALQGKSVIEIGCGNADFLTQLCAKGGNHGAGYDPSQQSRVLWVGDGSVTILAETFDPTDREPVDFVCSQHVLEHLGELGSTLQRARAILKPGGNGYFEVPNGLAIFRDLNVWDLTYEHVSYFSPSSLRHALSKADFSVLRMESKFGGQYLSAEVLADGVSRAIAPARAEETESCRDFPVALAKTMDYWKRRISSMIGSNRKIVLWGAGTKAVSFLNMLSIGTGDGIEYVVDINPRKAGRYLPGTAQQIIPPEDLPDCQPDVVIVMNPEYLSEIGPMVDSMGLDCDVITLSPMAMAS